MGKTAVIPADPGPDPGRNPVAVLLDNSIFLDARLRGHDEL
jgi:hypothetical protein